MSEIVAPVQAETSENPQKSKKRQILLEEVEAWLVEFYEFQYNEIKCCPEWRMKSAIESKPQPWRTMNDRHLVTIVRRLEHEGLKISKAKLHDLLVSEFSPSVNPISDYFTGLEWDGTNHIGKLAETVKPTRPENWEKYLTKWLVASVANAMTPVGCQNHTLLVLTGAQGKGKTTWLNNLCPKPIDPYWYCAKIDVNSKDTQTLLAECFVVNIDDQLRNLNRQDEDQIKSIITQPSVKYRRPYDRFITEYPRIANFCGSVNHSDFLTDPTGNRRFLPFQMEDVYLDKLPTLDVNQIWAQAYNLFAGKKYSYWFQDEEIIELSAHNEDFKVFTPEYEAISVLYRLPKAGEAPKYLNNSQIRAYLTDRMKMNRVSSKKIGEALRELGFEKIQRTNDLGKRSWVYPVIQLDLEEMTLVSSRVNGTQAESDSAEEMVIHPPKAPNF